MIRVRIALSRFEQNRRRRVQRRAGRGGEEILGGRDRHRFGQVVVRSEEGDEVGGAVRSDKLNLS